MSQAKFDQLVAIYRTVNFGENLRQGELVIADEAHRNQLSSLLLEFDEYGLRAIQGNIDQLQVGNVIEIEITDPRMSIGIIAANLADLLTAPKARFKEPIRYFIIQDKFCKTDQVIPESIQLYRQLIKLIALLKESAAYLDDETGELVFVDDGKFELPVLYTATEVINLNRECIDRLLISFDNDTHKEQKLAILAKSVRSVCGAAKPKERLIQLLEHLPELMKSFSEGYRLFVADFSYDKVVNQLEVAKLEEIGKIHKTFADVQNQILGIPVATIVVATQMKAATAIGYEFWVNTAVLIGCWIFVILSMFVLRNQLHTLNAIDAEIARKKQQMIDKYKAVEDLITKSFPFLEARLKTQRRAFLAVDIILVVGLLLSHLVYFSVTAPARQWAMQVLSGISPYWVN